MIERFREELPRLPDGGAGARELMTEVDLDYVSRDVLAALDTIQAGSERMQRVHGDLRAFIRGDAPDTIPADPSDGLRATVDMLRRSIPRGIRIEYTPGPLAEVRHQPGLLNQVFFNLIQNAADAVGTEGVVLVEGSAHADAIEVAVWDSGPGVPESAQGRLFEPFFTTKGVGKGTGLGLAISRQIVERQGGTLTLADAKCARFVVRLPRVH